MYLVRKLNSWAHHMYDAVLKLAARKDAMFYLFIISFAESSFFPIPPDVMMIPMILALPKKAWKIAALTTVASVIGGFFGYIIGYFFYDFIAEPILSFYGYLEQFDTFKNYYHKFGAWIVVIGGLTPFPYKVITITSGVVHLDLIVFGLASLVARGARFFIIAWLLYKFGNPIKNFIDKHLGILSVLFVVLLIGGFVMIKYL